MDRKNAWIVAGAILLGTFLFGLAQAVAQRDFRTEARPLEGGPAHYQVVNVTEGEIIIMDVTTGDLYSAKPRDVKPYEARPRAAAVKDKERFEFKDKDGVKDKDKFDFKDKAPFKDKDVFKGKAPFPDKDGVKDK